MPNTYTKIASVAVGVAGAASIDFTSIPATYTDLVIKVSGRITTTGGSYYVQFNNDTSSAYAYKALRNLSGSASSFGSASSTWAIEPKVPNTADLASTFSNDDIYIPNYASSNYKSVSSDNAKELNTANYDSANLLWAGIWNNTAAITTIKLVNTSIFLFQQYSTATLYGIVKS